MSLAFALVVSVTPAIAQEKLSLDVAVPVVNLPSQLFRPNGRDADFLGVGLGQTVDDARKILTDQNFSNESPSGRFVLEEEYSSVEIVASGPNRYPTNIVWSGPLDPAADQNIRVEFSSPLSGQHSTDVRRFVTYKGGMGPLVETLRAAIIQKYGPPSRDNKSKMEWYWSNGQPVEKYARDHQMLIGIDADGDHVKAVTYVLIDEAGARADDDRRAQFEKSVEDAAKKVRDAHAAAPKL
ncbi:hypothetical protein JQK88_34635 [Mesorhizobium caraganae]|uniref:hypothetical protein n=1 Tax=Mesorhizobium caraganae TaxID=483206 RepID=UPI001939A4DD|nr:hypothetical protein [Mesorhizobium caraganae]MBM2716208.1 hypothetical protein [Mesorhizobium caraganae]